MAPARVLIVEDEVIVAKDIQSRLTRLGYVVVGVTALGEEAVRLAGELRPNLVLMDIRLQGDIDGVTAAEQIHARHQLPVVYLTAYADDDTLSRAQVTEPFGYILKPFEERELRTVLEMALYKHQAERKLRESERRYAVTLGSIGDAVLATDGRGCVTFMNPVAEALTGWPQAEARGRPLPEVFHIINEETRAPVENPVARVLHTGTVVGLANHTVLVARNGREVPIDDCAAPIRDDDGSCAGVVLVFHDVSERKKLEQQFAHAQRMEAVGRLAGGVAHDFNNLLTAILSYTDLLLRSLLPGHPMREDLEEIRKAAWRAAELTRQLLAFGRKQVLQPGVLDLNQVVAGTERMLRRLIGEDVALVTDLAPGLRPVKADLGQVEQVIVNLAVNARDAMPRGGRLTMATANVVLGEAEVRGQPDVLPGAYVQLLISDTGGGMDEATLTHLFEPFFTTKEPGKGTGLGLATVYGIVTQSGGHIGVASEVGRGTTFRIWLPPAEGAPAPPLAHPEDAGLPGGKEAVLLVEDDEIVRGLARRILQDSGYTVLEARHGAEALAVSKRHAGPIHLLLTDVVMPGMPGPELARLLRQDRPECRVLFMSGYADQAAHQELLGAEAGVLAKPFTPAVLARTVRDALGGR